jgi:uncharacterized membrane protein YeaQ/YmgE (transglycosylase-associated protein family)
VEGEYVMGKAILTLIITFVVGIFCMAIGNDFMKGRTEFGILCAIAVMGALVVYFNEKKNKEKE